MQTNLSSPQNNGPIYGLKCSYYTKKFNSINELVNDVMITGMDPNYEITKNGKGIGETAFDFIQF
jgi:hypothetical protein